MAIVKGMKLPFTSIKGGLNQNKSSRFFNKNGLKVYFSKGSQKLSARRFYKRQPTYDLAQLITRDRFSAAECAYKTLPKSMREALKQYLQSKGATSTGNLDLYRLFKSMFMSDKLDEFIRDVLDIKLVLSLERETYAKAYFILRAEDATPGEDYIEWSDGKHYYRTRLAKRWIPYDYARIFVFKDEYRIENVVWYFEKQLPNSGVCHFVVDKTFLYERWGAGTYYIMADYRGIWSNAIPIQVIYFPYSLWGVCGLFYRNLTRNIERWLTDPNAAILVYPEGEDIPSYSTLPKLVAVIYSEDRYDELSDMDFRDIIIKIYRDRKWLMLEVWHGKPTDHDQIFFKDTYGNVHLIADCPPNSNRLEARVWLHPTYLRIIRLDR